MMDIELVNETRIAKVEDAEKAVMRGDFNEAMVLFALIANLSMQMDDEEMARRFSAKATKMKEILDSMAPEEREIYGYDATKGQGLIPCASVPPERRDEVCHELFMRINKIERHLMDLDLLHLNGEMGDREYKARRAALVKVRTRLEASM